MSTLARLLEEKREAILRAAAHRGATHVRIFGSVARQQDDEQSDIDFLVDFEPERSLLDHAGLVVDLESLLARRVDVTTTSALRGAMRDRILREARPL
ncbi:MAG: nucleotidyltransferase family protein [Myxococcota bacterium]